MKKKIFIVQMLDSKNPSGKSFTQVNDALFYSNDTDAHLVFLPHEQEGFEFNEATVALYNLDDESLVERPAVIETFEGRKSVVLKMTEDLLAHWGRWQAQVVFKQGDKVNTSVVVKFDTLRYMLDQRPPTLRDVIKVDELYSQLVTVMDEIAGKDVISAPEIILARGGENTLGERLDKEHSEFTEQLEEFEVARDGEVTLQNRLARDFGNMDNFRPDKVSMIDKLMDEFGERSINVKWFGAKGDGINDDVPGIQAAIDFAEVTGGTVLMPRIDNNWMFLSKNENNNCIEVPSGVRIISEKLPTDKSKQIIKVMVQGVENVIHLKGGNNLEIENLYIDTNGLAKKGICSTGYISKFLIKNIRVNSATEIGVDIMGYLGELNNVTAFKSPIGTKVHGGEIGGTSTQLNRVYSVECDTNILLHNMTYSQLSTCASDRNMIAYHIVKCKGITILNPGIEDNITTDPNNKLVNYQPFLIENSNNITLTNPCFIVSPSVPGYTIPSLIRLVDVNGFNIESVFVNFINYDKILKMEGNTSRVQVNDKSFDAGRVTNDSTSESRVEYMGYKADSGPKNRWNASLLNGWKGEVRYTKNDTRIVTVFGEIYGGDTTEYTKIAQLAKGYRPSRNASIPLVTNVSGTVGQYIYITEQGGIHVPRGVTLSGTASYHFNYSYEAVI